MTSAQTDEATDRAFLIGGAQLYNFALQAKPPLVDRPGDSGITGKGKKGESIDLRVTAPAGTKLYFICVIHPWMQAEVDVT